MVLYSRKLPFDLVLTCVTECIVLGSTLLKRKKKKGKKKRQGMEKSVQNLVMFHHDEALQVPEEEMAFE